MIITIDGPVGTGKSTIAKLLAKKLHFQYFDTGAIYRLVTYGIIKHQIPIENEKQLQNLLDNLNFETAVIDQRTHYFFEGEDITDKIRENVVTALVSEISAIKVVREKLVKMQRDQAIGNAIFEGRDMGSVVFPEADVKFFLTATAKMRAKRRFEELKCKVGPALKFDAVLKSIKQRDTYDSTRKISPLKKAKDAIVIDTSNLTIEEVLEKIIEILKRELAKLGLNCFLSDF